MLRLQLVAPIPPADQTHPPSIIAANFAIHRSSDEWTIGEPSRHNIWYLEASRNTAHRTKEILMDTLSSRIAALESEVVKHRRDLRRARAMSIGLVVAVAACLIAASPGTRSVLDDLKVNSLQIVDANGKPRIDLRVLADGPAPGANVTIYDDKGRTKFGIQEDKDGATLVVHDDKGQIRSMIAADKNGGQLSFSDESLSTRVQLGAGKSGPNLVFRDENKVVRGTLGLGKDGPALAFFDEKRINRSLLVLRSVGPGLIFRDDADKSRCLFGIVTDGPVLKLYDVEGKPIAALP
jgi:hypothetical protein